MIVWVGAERCSSKATGHVLPSTVPIWPFQGDLNVRERRVSLFYMLVLTVLLQDRRTYGNSCTQRLFPIFQTMFLSFMRRNRPSYVHSGGINAGSKGSKAVDRPTDQL